MPDPFSDECLRATVLAQLSVNERTAQIELRVGVLNGIAHLAGKVKTLEARTAAEEIAQGVEGVRGVVNRIEAPGAPSPARTIHLDLRESRSLNSNKETSEK
jgi:hypothetical protein